MAEALDRNSVVVANQLNVSLFSLPWLMRQGITTEEQVLPGAIFVPQMVQMRTADYELLLLPDRMQATMTCDEQQQAQTVVRVIGGIVRALPHTPYTAAGLNFVWLLPCEGDFAHFNRRLIHAPPALAQQFAEDNARFGAYLSKVGIHGGRLRIEIKPTRREERESLAMSFNYSLDSLTRDNAVAEIEGLLARWDDARRDSETIANMLEAGL